MRRLAVLAVVVSGVALGLCAGEEKNRAERQAGKAASATKPSGKGEDRRKEQDPGAGSNLEYWLQRAAPAETRPAPAVREGADPFGDTGLFRRADALPGVVEFSDGSLLAGGLYTTREKPWLVYVAKRKRWRRVPFLAVLSLSAVVIEEKMVQEWRWKAMGEPERVYTGREYPTRRFLWKLRLIDGTTVTGAIKGQPLWIERGGEKKGPYLLHERSKGKMGQKLSDIVHVKKVYVSRRLMDKVVQRPKTRPATRPGNPHGQAAGGLGADGP